MARQAPICLQPSRRVDAVCRRTLANRADDRSLAPTFQARRGFAIADMEERGCVPQQPIDETFALLVHRLACFWRRRGNHHLGEVVPVRRT